MKRKQYQISVTKENWFNIFLETGLKEAQALRYFWKTPLLSIINSVFTLFAAQRINSKQDNTSENFTITTLETTVSEAVYKGRTGIEEHFGQFRLNPINLDWD